MTVSINQAFSQIEEVELNPEGIVFPRYNTADRDNLSPVIGQCIYNTDHSFVECFDGTDWIASSKRFVGFLSKPFPSTLILTNRSLNVVDFGNILKDPTNSFDGQDFTAPEDGYYYFETQVGFEKDQVDIPDLTGFVSLQNVNAAHYRLMINDRRVSVKVSGLPN